MTDRLRAIERWIAWVRLGGVAFAALEIGYFTKVFPEGYRARAWYITAAFAAGTLLLLWLTNTDSERRLRVLGYVAVAFDTLVICAYSWLFAYEYGNQTRFALIFVVVEAAIRYGLRGGAALPLLLIPFFWFVEWWRAREFHPPGPGFNSDYISGPVGMLFLTGLIVGWLVRRLDVEAGFGRERADEAERLRDELGRRADVLEAANRCARALGSSLEIEPAFAAFIREVRGLVPFDRTAIVLVDGDSARTIATAGQGANEVFPPGQLASPHPAAGIGRDRALQSYPSHDASPQRRAARPLVLLDHDARLAVCPDRSRPIGLVAGHAAVQSNHQAGPRPAEDEHRQQPLQPERWSPDGRPPPRVASDMGAARLRRGRGLA